jgi:lactoylglutathione lyase
MRDMSERLDELIDYRIRDLGSTFCPATEGRSSMIDGWLSLRVEDPKAVGAWYEKLGFEIVGARADVGSVVVGNKKRGRILVLLPGETIEHPDRLQIHFAVPDVDAEYERLTKEGVQFQEPPKDMPWRWRHAYTNDPAGHTVELCTPLPDAKDLDASFLRAS